MVGRLSEKELYDREELRRKEVKDLIKELSFIEASIQGINLDNKDKEEKIANVYQLINQFNFSLDNFLEKKLISSESEGLILREKGDVFTVVINYLTSLSNQDRFKFNQGQVLGLITSFKRKIDIKN